MTSIRLSPLLIDISIISTFLTNYICFSPFFSLFFVQVDALVQLVKHFGWTWVGVIAGDDAYGHNGANIFANEV